jgi:hypothetical protein
LSPTRAVRNMPNQSPNTLNVPPWILSQVALNTCSKVRKFLCDAVHLHYVMADNPDHVRLPYLQFDTQCKKPDSTSQRISGQETSTRVSEAPAIAWDRQ